MFTIRPLLIKAAYKNVIPAKVGVHNILKTLVLRMRGSVKNLTNRDFLIYCIIILFILFAGCDPMESKVRPENSFEASIKTECIKTINSHRILFAHMSVGDNILSGLALENSKLKEQITIHNINTISKIDTQKLGINHLEIGANTQPLQKLSNFRQFLFSNNNGLSFDLVGIKFCYVDITSTTDIHAVLNEYTELVKDVKKRYPHIKFVHFTVPLTTHYRNLKSRIKHMILGDQDNIARNTYNELLCKAYKSDEIIDIAGIESTYSDGNRMIHSHFQTSHYSLIPAYTTDGGHLNDLGKRIVVLPFVEGLCKALPN